MASPLRARIEHDVLTMAKAQWIAMWWLPLFLYGPALAWFFFKFGRISPEAMRAASPLLLQWAGFILAYYLVVPPLFAMFGLPEYRRRGQEWATVDAEGIAVENQLAHTRLRWDAIRWAWIRPDTIWLRLDRSFMVLSRKAFEGGDPAFEEAAAIVRNAVKVR